MKVGPGSPAPVTSLHPSVLPYLSAHWAMEAQAHTQLMHRLMAIPADARLNLFEEDDSDNEQDETGGAARANSGKPKKLYQIVGGGIAVLPLVGVLQKREDWFTRWYPEEATATSTFIAALKATKADPDVTCRVMYGHSPGGMVDGTPEATDAVYAARQDGKPIISVSAGLCCSACYCIMSQAHEFYAGSDDMLGSIGTRWRLLDTSAMYQTLGMLPVEITSGIYKAAGADGLPITERDKAYFQSLVDTMQERFTSSVARGRKLPIDDVRAIAKEARIYIGKDAQANGLVDAILTPTEVFQRLQKSGGKTAKTITASTTAAASGKKEQSSMSEKTKTFRERIAAMLGEADPDETPVLTVPTASTVPVSAPAHPVLTAALAAGITTAEQFADFHKKAQAHDGLKVKADAYDGMVTTQRTETKKLLVALYPDVTERAAEEAVIDALPAGVALDRYCKTVQASHDAKLGTTATQPAPRLTQAPAASPKTIAAELSSEEEAELDNEVSASFDNSFGKKKD